LPRRKLPIYIALYWIDVATTQLGSLFAAEPVSDSVAQVFRPEAFTRLR